MASTADFVSTREAARLLGVSVQQVNRIIEAGELTRVARGLVDRTSIERYRAARHGGRKRVWAQPTAWAAIALLSGEDISWLGQVQAWRLRSTLLETTNAGDLITRCRDRADVRTYRGHSSVLSHLRGEIVSPAAALIGLADSASSVDGYVSTEAGATLASRYALKEDDTGTITLRATDFDIYIVTRLARASSVLAALDAATSLDPRSRGVGERVLGEALARFSE
ncbi:MAG TPA: helix-turn-helix domain-containing protein [Nocardioidaceae bacterium]|nr:helix-turn-helix domain-containing protein [Nocardioidaceae bacterium]